MGGLIAALIFACTFCVAWLVLGRLMRRSLAVSERLAYYAQPASRAAAKARWSGMPSVDRVMGRYESLSDWDQRARRAFEDLAKLLGAPKPPS